MFHPFCLNINFILIPLHLILAMDGAIHAKLRHQDLYGGSDDHQAIYIDALYTKLYTLLCPLKHLTNYTLR